MNRNCLSQDTLTNYLEGLLDAPLRKAAEGHMVECDFCRSQLASYMRILDEEVLDEEDTVIRDAIARFDLRHQGWPGRAGGAGRRRRGRPFRVVVMLSLAASVIAIVGVGVFSWLRPPSSDDVLQSIFLDRPFLGRFAGQVVYAPFSETRAPGGSVDSALEGALIDPSDYERGTYLLAVGDFESGVPIMRDVVEETRSATAHNNLGLAYMEMRAPPGAEGGFEAARREFQAAIDADPEFAEPVFNMAVLLAREGMNDQALRYASEYTALDPDSSWADEIEKLTGVLGP